MGPDKINVRGDPRIEFKSAVLNGRTYGRPPAASLFTIYNIK
jgi:hypothetical protein